MEKQEALREVAVLRHAFHIKGRLKLEFLANISKLLREYDVPADDELLSSLVLAIPEELTGNGNGAKESPGAKAASSPSGPTEPVPPTGPTLPPTAPTMPPPVAPVLPPTSPTGPPL